MKAMDRRLCACHRRLKQRVEHAGEARGVQAQRAEVHSGGGATVGRRNRPGLVRVVVA
jgi:hypothetical protein